MIMKLDEEYCDKQEQQKSDPLSGPDYLHFLLF